MSKSVSWYLEEEEDEKKSLILLITLVFQQNIQAGDYKLAEEINKD
jgi:hypothetical protein